MANKSKYSFFFLNWVYFRINSFWC